MRASGIRSMSTPRFTPSLAIAPPLETPRHQCQPMRLPPHTAFFIGKAVRRDLKGHMSRMAALETETGDFKSGAGGSALSRHFEPKAYFVE